MNLLESVHFAGSPFRKREKQINLLFHHFGPQLALDQRSGHLCEVLDEHERFECVFLGVRGQRKNSIHQSCPEEWRAIRTTLATKQMLFARGLLHFTQHRQDKRIFDGVVFKSGKTTAHPAMPGAHIR
mgnify:CR=1 FL=1